MQFLVLHEMQFHDELKKQQNSLQPHFLIYTSYVMVS